MPPEDRQISPHTGFTREHWATVADNLLLSVRRYRSPAGGQIDLPGAPARAGARSDGLEGFARTFLLAAVRLAGEGGDDAHGIFDGYVQGMIAGTRGAARGTAQTPGETWQPISDTGPGGQPMVESASIALGLWLTRRWSWDVLDDEQRDDVTAWLRRALCHEPAANNWYFFPLTVAGFLESVGSADAETQRSIERGLDLLESWYRGEGWYSDGGGRAFDHYIGWAMHFYPVIFAHLRARDAAAGSPGTAAADLLDTVGDRLRVFLRSFTLTFDRNGSPLYQGRSLTYRVATVASVALGEVTGVSPLRPGQSRLLLSGTLRYFLERGAVSSGLLSRGWHGEHAATVQPYSGPASPYWASKGFLGLLLPPSHGLWSATEERLDDDRADLAHPIAPIGWLVHRTGQDGIARVHNHGSDHLMPEDADGGAPDPLYARFAYSTRTGCTHERNVSDNDVQVTVRDVTSVRRRIHPLGAGAGWAASYHVPQFPAPTAISGGGAARKGPVLPSCRVESLVLVRGSWEVRVHRFVGVPAGTPARLSGWALAATTPAEIGVAARTAGPTGAGVVLTAPALRSELIAVEGWSAAATRPAPAGTAYGRFAVVPELTGVVRPGFFVALARLTESDDAEPPAISTAGTTVTVRWRDGEHQLRWARDLPQVEWVDPEQVSP